MTPSGAGHRMRRVVVVAATGLFLCLPVVATVDAPTGSWRVATAAVPAEQSTTTATAAVPVEQSTTTATEPDPGEVSEPGSAPKPAGSGGAAKAAVAAAEQAAGDAELAVAVFDRRTGELAVGSRGHESLYTASLSKVVLAVDMLDRRRLEGLAIGSTDVDLLRRALGASDDAAMSTLWGRFDGPGAAGRVSKRLGLAATTAPRDPSQWGEMSVSAADTVRTWRHILEDMPDADRDLLVSAMNAAPSRAADGFDQAFGLLSPQVDEPDGPGAVAKQGWMCCVSGNYYLHSAGVVGGDRQYLVTLLTRISSGRGWDAARGVVTAAATEAVRALDRRVDR